jgi:hypothetical protein
MPNILPRTALTYLQENRIPMVLGGILTSACMFAFNVANVRSPSEQLLRSQPNGHTINNISYGTHGNDKVAYIPPGAEVTIINPSDKKDMVVVVYKDGTVFVSSDPKEREKIEGELKKSKAERTENSSFSLPSP